MRAPFSANFAQFRLHVSLLGSHLFQSRVLGWGRNCDYRFRFRRSWRLLCCAGISGGASIVSKLLLVSLARFCLALGLVSVVMYVAPLMTAFISVLAAAMIVPSLYVFFRYGYRWLSELQIKDFLTADKSQIANITRYSLPFVAASLSAALMGLADRVVIEQFLGLRAVGLYIWNP